jgi:hypothetical protein
VKLLDQQGEDNEQQQQQRRPAITDSMSPLVIAADTQAEQ